jgi:hypothetical protein
MEKAFGVASNGKKQQYKSPALTLLGSVKELTGTKSASGTTDAMTMMTTG